MKIHFLTQTYPPEIGGAPHLIHALSLCLQDRGHQITVYTGYPSYHLKEIPKEYQRGLWMKDTLDGIQVRRIRIPQLPRDRKIARGLEHFIFGVWLNFLNLFSQRADVSLVFSPPLPLSWLACLIGKIRSVPVVINIQDLFPLEAVELGMLHNRVIIKIFEMMEEQIHRWAMAITVHSPGNKEHVLRHRGAPGKVHVLYNWVDTDHIQPGPKDNEFSRQHGLANRFVVSYAGTMGWAQDMGTIIECAACLRDTPEILFLLVGEGVEKEAAFLKSKELGLNNILWLPIQPFSVYPQIMAASDISLINLHPKLRTPVVPSKLLSIMAAGRPVVASLPPESDARLIITQADCGICVDAGDGAALAQAILTLHSNPTLANDFGKRGRAFAEANFSREACSCQIESIFQKIIGVS
jgi:glycosyltransferase involved in cell wall biosynthesis